MKKYGRDVIRNNIEMYSLFLPVAIIIIIFSYIPIYGVVVAFQNYAPGSPFIGPNVRWVGLTHFIQFYNSPFFSRIMWNTVYLSMLGLFFTFWAPIIFTLLLNEVRHTKYKRFIQTASYLPHFISMVVVAGMAIAFVNTDGLINILLGPLGLDVKNHRLSASAFPTIYTVTNIWKTFGFGSILYFSALTSIDPNLYEAAKIDGANRIRQAWHITIPGLRNIIVINIILSVSQILGSNTEFILLFYNPAIYETSDVLGTYIFRLGIEGGRFSLTAAIGLFMSVIGFILAFSANKISKKISGFGLW